MRRGLKIWNGIYPGRTAQSAAAKAATKNVFLTIAASSEVGPRSGYVFQPHWASGFLATIVSSSSACSATTDLWIP